MLSGRAKILGRSHLPCENLPGTLRDAESKAIAVALDTAKGNQSEAARILGCTRQGLRLMIKRLAVKRKAYLKEGK